MEPDPDEVCHPGYEEILWEAEVANSMKGKKAGASYNKITDKAVHLLSHEKQCALFCGGKKCRFELAECWTSEQMAIKGLYSNWVTDNILAMARPNTPNVIKYNMIDQFHSEDIRTVINLQLPGEHSKCGSEMDPSGFSYSPQMFMENNIFFYNFGWQDHGVASLSKVLDMVKVMQFAMSEGKIAIHCHAGLGRTCMLIACYLVFTNRMTSNEAIHYLRAKRPKCIQTRGQIQCIQSFEQYLKPFRVVFSAQSQNTHEFSLCQYLNRQKHLLHGYEARKLKYIPKVIYVICERLLEIAERGTALVKFRNSSNGNSAQLFDDDATSQSSFESSSAATAVHSPFDRLRRQDSLSHSQSLEALNNIAFKSVLKNKIQREEEDSGSSSTEKEQVSPRVSSDDDDSIVYGKETPKTSQYQAGKKHILVGQALAEEAYSEQVTEAAVELETRLNTCDEAWLSVASETDPAVLGCMLWHWLDQLKEPPLRRQDMNSLLDAANEPETGLLMLEKGVRTTIEYMLKVLVKLHPIPDAMEDRIFEKLLSHLTHQTVLLHGDDVLSTAPRRPHWSEMKSNAAQALFRFFYNLMDKLQSRHKKK